MAAELETTLLLILRVSIHCLVLIISPIFIFVCFIERSMYTSQRAEYVHDICIMYFLKVLHVNINLLIRAM